jgi:hypothetical protein
VYRKAAGVTCLSLWLTDFAFFGPASAICYWFFRVKRLSQFQERHSRIFAVLALAPRSRDTYRVCFGESTKAVSWRFWRQPTASSHSGLSLGAGLQANYLLGFLLVWIDSVLAFFARDFLSSACLLQTL